LVGNRGDLLPAVATLSRAAPPLGPGSLTRRVGGWSGNGGEEWCRNRGLGRELRRRNLCGPCWVRLVEGLETRGLGEGRPAGRASATSQQFIGQVPGNVQLRGRIVWHGRLGRRRREVASTLDRRHRGRRGGGCVSQFAPLALVGPQAADFRETFAVLLALKADRFAAVCRGYSPAALVYMQSVCMKAHIVRRGFSCSGRGMQPRRPTALATRQGRQSQ
jgi:hypothetical protein